jgi:hypothetical protein
MGISMNPKMSGFRKWAEIHDPEMIGEVRTAVNKGAVATADGDQAAKTPDRQPHRPWLVPGAGRL